MAAMQSSPGTEINKRKKNINKLNSPFFPKNSVCFFGGFIMSRDRVLLGEPIEVGTAQPDSLNIVLLSEGENCLREMPQDADGKKEIRFKSN